jgi:hypothetical protein
VESGDYHLQRLRVQGLRRPHEALGHGVCMGSWFDSSYLQLFCPYAWRSDGEVLTEQFDRFRVRP